MHDPERLVRIINNELHVEHGIRNAYKDLCGKLTMHDIFTTDSVYISARRCARGFKHKRDTQVFMQSPWENSYILCRKVLSGRFRPEYYKQREINERGKLRVIRPPKFECKVVQKVLCDYVVRPTLEPRMIYSNYASVRGKGTSKMYEDVHKAVNRAVGRNIGDLIVMIDFSKYFANIDLDILFAILGRYIRDQKLLDLIRMFSPGDFGLSLGNELSQVPASFFPSRIDHRIKDEMRIRDYFRYMDDSLAIVKRDRCEEYLSVLREEAERLGIIINDDKIIIREVGKPFVFCKERFLFDRNKGRYYRIQNPRIARCERKKLKSFRRKLDAGQMTIRHIERQYKGVRGMISSHPNTIKTIRELDALYNSLFSE